MLGLTQEVANEHTGGGIRVHLAWHIAQLRARARARRGGRARARRGDRTRARRGGRSSMGSG